MKLLITGGAGFIGHHLVEGVLKETDWNIVILDRLDISGNLERIRDIEIWEAQKHRVKFVWWDLKAELNEFAKNDIGEVDCIWHLAASSHVNRSIENPLSFVMDNVVGTCNILNFARTLPELKRFIYFSTDEVFGPAEKDYDFKEWDRYKSGNPYAATKAGGEELSLAFHNTYGLPIIIGHTMNVFGERQHPEKFIPIIVRSILKEEKITVHDGSRYWIHARNVCNVLLFLNVNGVNGDKYNLVGEEELSNVEVVRTIKNILNLPVRYEVVDTTKQRPGHDKRYSLDGTKLKTMGFIYPKTFYQSFEKTIKWIADESHRKWLNL